MAFDGDPYRTLGLARGASVDEVKRAYRRLAKTHHPDAAGSGALARFLAIQAAYEQLVEGSPEAGPGPGRPSARARRASEADPDRAEATRRAYGARSRPRRAADEPSKRAGGPGDPPGRRRTTEAGDAGPTGPESARRRGKATLGSTSYDDATAGSFEPDWSGASWYGTTSGTYWTINPKEYADPRKHGPEYQARARRASGGARPEPNTDDVAAEPAGAPGAGRASANAGPPAAGAAAEDGASGASGAPDPPGRIHGSGPWQDPTAGPSDPVAGHAAWRTVGEGRSASGDQVPDPARALAELARALTDSRSGGSRGRVIRAFVGWLPIALGIGWLFGEITGCGRFAATCDPSVDPLVLLLQGAALVALLLLPTLASLAASAALGLIVAAVAATLVLSATGAAADEGSRRVALGVLLLVAWLAGLAIAIVQRVRAPSSRVGPVS